jgi:hypothetical protein
MLHRGNLWVAFTYLSGAPLPYLDRLLDSVIKTRHTGLSIGGRQRASIAGDRLWVSRVITTNFRYWHFHYEKKPSTFRDRVEYEGPQVEGECIGGRWDGSQKRAVNDCSDWKMWNALQEPLVPLSDTFKRKPNMKINPAQIVTRLFAVYVLAIAAMFAASAAADLGGGSLLDQILLVSLAIAICLATHLIPALTKNKWALGLWVGCLVITIYGHINFFTHASLRANEARAEKSAMVSGFTRQINAAKEALAEIRARPVSVISDMLAKTEINIESRAVRRSLRDELAEAKRSAVLHDAILKLEGQITVAVVKGAADPVTALLVTVTGIEESKIILIINLGRAILLELVGVWLWMKVLSGYATPESRTTPATIPPIPETVKSATPTVNIEGVVGTRVATPLDIPVADQKDDVDDLKAAVESGDCQLTVNGVRKFLGCGQAKALEVRRALIQRIGENAKA